EAEEFFQYLQKAARAVAGNDDVSGAEEKPGRIFLKLILIKGIVADAFNVICKRRIHKKKGK
ncbi:MAG: hypothetical protein ABRQ28_03325, partial [Smithellaceae bacterium]